MPENLYEYGNRSGFFAPLKDDGTFDAKQNFAALMEVNINFSQETSDISVEDDPAYISRRTPLVGDGTVKIAALPVDTYAKLFDLKTDSNQVTVGKSTAKAKPVAFGFISKLSDGSETVIVLYKCDFSVPDIVTKSDDGQTIRDISLKVKVKPFQYTAAGGAKEFATFAIINSMHDAKAYAYITNTGIYVPDQVIPA